MPTVNVVDRTGKTRETLELAPAVFGAPVNGVLLHQAVVRELAGRRAGTHATRGRSDVSGGGKKPWRQKGTGRARQGSIRATQWKGGGRPFGPKPRSYAQDMPRQARRAALRSALSVKAAEGQVMVVDGLDLGDGKTKALVGLLARLGVAGVRTLIVVTERSDALRRASRNVPWLTLVLPGQLTVAELLRHERLVFEPPALVAVQEGLGP
ncbi:MAG: 50S ribosomal protein L4 [Candidatus Rokuibacteriota bacterium]|nr:MAG: 50S ribosomal protein L4 [Candidatus Rokubacteria bacterium]